VSPDEPASGFAREPRPDGSDRRSSRRGAAGCRRESSVPGPASRPGRCSSLAETPTPSAEQELAEPGKLVSKITSVDPSLPREPHRTMDGRQSESAGRGEAAGLNDAPPIKIGSNPARCLVVGRSTEQPCRKGRRFMRGERSHSRIMPLFHQLPYVATAQSPRTLKHVLERASICHRMASGTWVSSRLNHAGA
jgi:hypothetical protein